MSGFNGSGVWVLSGTGLPFVTGTTISSTVANQLNTDLATGLSTCITKDGQSTPTANIPMGGFKLTGLALATTTGDALSFGRAISAGATTITSASATALAVGLNGATNPAFQVDASTAVSATGIKIKSAAAAGGVAVSVITSGTNEALAIDAAGSGTITLGGTSTGAIVHTRATTLSAALTYGGVTLSNAVTGSGNMVLSVSPTVSGTLTTAAITAGGFVSVAGNFAQGATTGGWTGNALNAVQNTTGACYSAYNSGAGVNMYFRLDDTSGVFCAFNASSTPVGSITTNGTTTAYNTTSDARLKESIADAGDPWSILKALKVRQWDWKSTGRHEDFGFVAQEENEVYPEAIVAGDKDPDTIAMQWYRDDSKLVPLLVKAVQMLEDRLAKLEAV